MFDQSHALLKLLRRARRRYLSHLVLSQAALALSLAMGGLVLMLLVGTQVLEWYWIVVLLGGALVLGGWQTWRQVPSLYRLAQILDSRAGLHDALSTAYYFGSVGKPRSEEIRLAQLELALAAVPVVDLRQALPAPRPRSLYAVSGLAMVACGLFAVRYGVTQSLDLRPSLVRMAMHRFLPEEPAYEASQQQKKKPLRAKLADELEKLGIKIGDGDQSRGEAGPESATDATEAPQAASESSNQNAKAQTAKVDATDPSQEGDPQEGAEGASAQGQQPGDGSASTDSNSSQPSQDKNAQKKGNKSGSQNPSMMDRMRDAMASLMNKLKMQPKGEQSEQASSKQSQNGNQSSQGQKGSPMPGKAQSNSQSQGDETSQQGQGDKSQMAQGRSGDKSGNSQPSPDAKNGIGKEDGDKSAREAEQLAAMGKLSEIIGKRAQNLSGDIMVEVQSNNRQQLKTAYSGKQAAHAEAGGEITRDEVPLIYQQYVQQYFEQVHKIAPAAPGSKPKAPRVSN